MERRDRYRGALLGLATGDSLGTTLEFRAPGSFNKIDDMVGGGPFYLAPGEWTDDTSMALCLAESLIEKGRSCGWPQFHFSFLVRRKPQSKSLERALAQLMERRLQSMPADIWALLL